MFETRRDKLPLPNHLPEHKHTLPSPKRSLDSWWQVGGVLTVPDVQRLQNHMGVLQRESAQMSALLKRVPGPTPKELTSIPWPEWNAALEDLVSILQAHTIPEECARWQRDAVELVERLYRLFDAILSCLQRLYHLRPTTQAYGRCMSEARLTLMHVQIVLQNLAQHLDNYLSWASAETHLALVPRRQA
jgi:hypothetical protein